MKEPSLLIYECFPSGVRMKDAQYELDVEKMFSPALPCLLMSEKESFQKPIQEGICEVRTSKDGSLVARWTVYKGKKQGLLQYFFPSGQVSAERWYVDDLVWGRAIDFYPEGTMKAQYGYRKGQLHGFFRSWRLNGTISLKGKYLDGLPHGTFEQMNVEGQWQRVTHFDRGRRNGADSGFSEDGYLLFLDIWKEGVRQKEGFIDCIQRYLESEIVARP